jgi:hypothetical protein
VVRLLNCAETTTLAVVSAAEAVEAMPHSTAAAARNGKARMVTGDNYPRFPPSIWLAIERPLSM